MTAVAIIPIKSFRHGNQRLASALDERRRHQLGMALGGHVVRIAKAGGLIPLVVTGDPEVAEWAESQRATSHPDPGDGLDAAAGAGVEWAARTDSSWLVLHGDLPLLGVTDIHALTSVLGDGLNPIAPSSDGGTSALGGRDPLAFSFGKASFHRHLSRVPAPSVLVRRGLSLDVDSPHDLETAVSAAAGAWLGDALR